MVGDKGIMQLYLKKTFLQFFKVLPKAGPRDNCECKMKNAPTALLRRWKHYSIPLTMYIVNF